MVGVRSSIEWRSNDEQFINVQYTSPSNNTVELTGLKKIPLRGCVGAADRRAKKCAQAQFTSPRHLRCGDNENVEQ